MKNGILARTAGVVFLAALAGSFLPAIAAGAEKEAVITGDGEVRVRVKGRGTLVEERIYRFPETVDQALPGDIDNDGQDELLLFSHRKENENRDETRGLNCYTFTLSVYRIKGSLARMLWSDNGGLEYAHSDIAAPDELGAVGDIDNSGTNRLVVMRPRSDVSPAGFDILAWRDGRLAVEQRDVTFAGETILGLPPLENAALRDNEPFVMTAIGIDDTFDRDRVVADLAYTGKNRELILAPARGAIRNNAFVVTELLKPSKKP